jgi:hypothetical protein
MTFTGQDIGQVLRFTPQRLAQLMAFLFLLLALFA